MGAKVDCSARPPGPHSRCGRHIFPHIKLMNWVALGFALIGITLFWFVERFYPLPRRWRWAANIVGAVIYTLFL